MIANQVDCFDTLFNNPFLLSPVLPAFYAAYGNRDKNILLSYLVLPLVLPPASRNALVHLNLKSSMRTFLKKRERVYGLAKNIAAYRRLTNNILQHNVDSGLLTISQRAALAPASAGKSYLNGICPADILKAAGKLGVICRPHSIPAIFLQFGIKHL
jgi:hypothetical protein